MSSFFESSKDTYRQQLEALEQMGQATEADSISLGLMQDEGGKSGDYIWDFITKLREERKPFQVETSAPAPMIYPEVNDLDIEQFEKAVQGMSPRYMRDMAEGMEDARTMRESAGTDRGESPRPQLRPNTELVDVTDTDEGKLSNPEPLYKMAEEVDPGTIKTEGLMSRPAADTPTFEQRLEERLVELEGFEAEAYKPIDTEEHYTIGYGHYGSDVKKGTVLTEPEARELLRKDIEKRMPKIRKAIPNFDDLSDDLKVEIAQSWFRGGISGSPKAIKLINEGKFDEAAVEFLDNEEYRTTELDGVKTRMEALADALKKEA